MKLFVTNFHAQVITLTMLLLSANADLVGMLPQPQTLHLHRLCDCLRNLSRAAVVIRSGEAYYLIDLKGSSDVAAGIL